MRGKLMTRRRHIERIYCLRCGRYQAHFLNPCECKPIWTCMDGFQAELCHQQQCVYCVGATEWRPRRYPRIFNVIAPTKEIREDSVYRTRT
jgi:hypothetical protein